MTHRSPGHGPGLPEGLGSLCRGYLLSLTWQKEQNVSAWHSKHGSAPFFFTMFGWYVRHGLLGTAPLWWQLSQKNWLWQFAHWTFVTCFFSNASLCGNFCVLLSSIVVRHLELVAALAERRVRATVTVAVGA